MLACVWRSTPVQGGWSGRAGVGDDIPAHNAEDSLVRPHLDQYVLEHPIRVDRDDRNTLLMLSHAHLDTALFRRVSRQVQIEVRLEPFLRGRLSHWLGKRTWFENGSSHSLDLGPPQSQGRRKIKRECLETAHRILSQQLTAVFGWFSGISWMQDHPHRGPCPASSGHHLNHDLFTTHVTGSQHLPERSNRFSGGSQGSSRCL